MTDPSIPMRIKRGFHRVGLALAIVLAVCIVAVGAVMSVDAANLQQRRSICGDEKHNSPNPYSKIKAQLEDERAGAIPCDFFSDDEIAESRNKGFSYSATLAMYLAETMLIASLVGLAAYFSVAGLVAGISWIVRGFVVGG
jgi:hypothetical protein